MAPFIGKCDSTQCGTLRCREREPSTPSVAPHGSAPFCARCLMMGADHCAVDYLKCIRHDPAFAQDLQDLLPRTRQGPASELAVDTGPLPELCQQVTPRRACPGYPENPIKNEPMVGRFAPVRLRLGGSPPYWMLTFCRSAERSNPWVLTARHHELRSSISSHILSLDRPTTSLGPPHFDGRQTAVRAVCNECTDLSPVGPSIITRFCLMRCSSTLDRRMLEFSGSVMATGCLRRRDNAGRSGRCIRLRCGVGLRCSAYAKSPVFPARPQGS